MSFRNLISKYIGLPLQDGLRGTQVINTLNLLLESQYWDNQKIDDYQIAKLRRLVDYAKENVPYYNDLFEEMNFSSKDIISLDDIQKIPILTKEIMRDQGDRLLSSDFKNFKVKIGKTGGTTGTPVKIYKDANNRSFTWASYYRWYEWLGLNYSDPTTSLWGARTVLSTPLSIKIENKIKSSILNSYTINTFEMSPNTFHKSVSKIKKTKTKLLKGYLSSLLEFAEYVDENNIHFPSLKALSSTTETLLPHNRIYLEKVFGVPIYNQYGCGEVSAISYECSKQNGLHINSEHVICEILDDKNNQIIDTPGRVIATDLDNLVMPFIRFENGDLATLSSHKCDCGVNQPLMASIEGRSSDVIILNNGIKVHGVFITDILYEIGVEARQVQRFQVIQREKEDIVLVLETKSKLEKVIEDKLYQALIRFFNKVEIKYSTKIPNEKNGKFRYIKSFLQ